MYGTLAFLYLLGNKRIDIKEGVPLNLVRQEEELRQKIAGLTAQIMEKHGKRHPFYRAPFILTDDFR